MVFERQKTENRNGHDPEEASSVESPDLTALLDAPDRGDDGHDAGAGPAPLLTRHALEARTVLAAIRERLELRLSVPPLPRRLSAPRFVTSAWRSVQAAERQYVDPIAGAIRWLALYLIGSAGWWARVFSRAIRGLDEHDCVMGAAAIAYYALFSFFPLILLLIVSISYMLESRTAQNQVISIIAANVPTSMDLVSENVQQVLRARGTVSVVAIITFIWSASGVFGTVDRAMNRIWNVPVLRSFWRGKLVAILAVLAIGTLAVTSLLITAVVTYIKSTILPLLASRLDVSIGPWEVLVVLIPYMTSMLLFMIVYRVFPYINLGWSDVWPGALLAGVLWEQGKLLFAAYIGAFGQYNLVYGSVGTIVALLLWFYVTALILLTGAELSSAYTFLRRTDRAASQP